MAPVTQDYAAAAEACFRQGWNCAQATAAPFAADLGLEPEFMRRALAGFGGGIGGLRETCGAVSAMAFVAGLRLGNHPADDLAGKTALYDTIQRMHAAFVARHGSACCRVLLERAGVAAGPTPSARDAAYYDSRPCAGLVAWAAKLIATVLADQADGPSPPRSGCR